MVTGSNNGSLCVITAGRLTPACPNISPGSFGALRVHTTDLGGLSAPRLGGMAPSVSLSTRVSPGLRERLLAEARARRMSIGTLARELLADAQDLVDLRAAVAEEKDAPTISLEQLKTELRV